MSRPKTVRSKTRSKVSCSECKPPAESKAAAKPATPDAAPDKNAETEHRVDAHKKSPAEEKPWSEWLWCEEWQMCYRGRQDSKGEWEYEIEQFKQQPKERPYTPPREDPIEYLVEDLKLIWEPRPIDGYLVTVTTAAAGNAPKKDGAGEEKVAKVKVVDEEEKKTPEAKEEKASEEDEESKTSSSKKPEKDEKVKKERYIERRGRQLERKHLTHKEKKEKVERWTKGLEI